MALDVGYRGQGEWRTCVTSRFPGMQYLWDLESKRKGWVREESWVHREDLSHLAMEEVRKKGRAVCDRAGDTSRSVSLFAVIRKAFSYGRWEHIQRLTTVQHVNS